MVFERGVGHFERKFQGEGGSSTNDFWPQKSRVPGLSCGVVCVILRLAVLIQYWRVTHRQTDRHTHAHRQTHDDGYYPRIASAARVKTKIRSITIDDKTGLFDKIDNRQRFQVTLWR